VLAFVLPVAFFSIFAGIFSGSGRSATGAIRSRRRRGRLGELAAPRGGAARRGRAGRANRARDGEGEEGRASSDALHGGVAEQAVRAGDLPVAVVIPKGFGERPISFRPGRELARTLRVLATARTRSRRRSCRSSCSARDDALPVPWHERGMEGRPLERRLTPEQKARA
jgi:hypothetical protein